MAQNRVFVSPGFYSSEKDLSFVTRQIGVTTLGLVGETTKGPAFQPIFISNYDEFSQFFGGLNAKKVKEVVKGIPITSISLETDSPYLTPEPYRGKPNNPLYLKYIIKEISDLKGISKDEVKNVTSQNVMSKFDL